MDLAQILGFAAAAGAVIGGVLVVGLRTAVTTGVTNAVQTGFDRANWPEKLRQELQQVRGSERQELRFKAYGALWAKQRPLALYDTHGVYPGVVRKLSRDLSDWYFSDAGGLLLTGAVRDFYFAFQDLLRLVAAKDDWRAERSTMPAKDIFVQVLKDEKRSDALATLDYLDGLGKAGTVPADWPQQAGLHARKWKDDVEELGKAWDRLADTERFAVLQQVSSVLRTAMTNDLESRMR